jgi:hypothetical protein
MRECLRQVGFALGSRHRRRFVSRRRHHFAQGFCVAPGPGSVFVAIFAVVVAVPTMMSTGVLVMFVVSMMPVMSMMLVFVRIRRVVVNCIVPIATS